MKRIIFRMSLLLLVSVLLIAWGGQDFYHFAANGTALLKQYPDMDSIREMVYHVLKLGIVKCILGFLIAAGTLLWFRWRKNR